MMNNKCYTWAEVIIDRLVPFAVIGLFIIIILDFFFTETAEKYHLIILIADYVIIGIFILDLIFKYLRIRNIKNFIKTCWLDIIAIFPFFLIFRAFESIILLAELPKEAQSVQLVFHEGVALSKESSRIVKEVEAAGKTSRVKTILTLFQKIENTPRIVKALPFYEQPVGKHHLHEIKGKKEYKYAKKELNRGVKDIENAPKEIVKETKKDYKYAKKELKKGIKEIPKLPKDIVKELKKGKEDIKVTIPQKIKSWFKK